MENSSHCINEPRIQYLKHTPLVSEPAPQMDSERHDTSREIEASPTYTLMSSPWNWMRNIASALSSIPTSIVSPWSSNGWTWPSVSVGSAAIKSALTPWKMLLL